MKSRLSELIKQYLNETGLTQAELAERCGTTPSQLSRLLNSTQQQIDLRTAERFRQVIGFQPCELLVIEEGNNDNS